MNLSPDNRVTLETLLAAMGGPNGVSGSQAAPILQATLQAQAQQQAERTARYQEMASNVANMAGAGMTYGGVENYLDTMTRKPGIPGQFQGLLESAFSNPELPPGVLPSPGEPGFASTSRQSPEIMSQLQSPMYTGNPQSPAWNVSDISPETGAIGPNFGELLTAPMQAQQMAFEAPGAPADPTSADMMGQVNYLIEQYKQAQYPVEEIAALVSQQPDAVGIIMDNLTEFMRMQPELMDVMMQSG